MSVKIRLARRGRKKRAMYDVVIADARAPRDGRFIEKIGTYNPNTDPASINIDNEKAFDWVMKGALPTDTVRAMLSYRGVMFRKHLQVGVNKGAISQEEADKKLAAWVEDKDSKIVGRTEELAKSKADARKARLEAEAKVSAARAEAIAAKNVVEEEVEEVEEEVVAETPVVEEAPAEEAVAETPVVEEAPAEEAVAEAAPTVEEAPAEEAAPEAIEEAPAAEVVEEAPAVEEAPKEEVVAEAAPEVEETPAAEVAEEAPKAEAEEAPAEEKKAE